LAFIQAPLANAKKSSAGLTVVSMCDASGSGFDALLPESEEPHAANREVAASKLMNCLFILV
jgi:hypothetical protein